MADMSDKSAQSEPASSEKKTPEKQAPRGADRRSFGRAPKPPRRGGALALLALILALLALAAVAFGGWQWWRQRDARQAGARTTAQLQKQVAALQSTLHDNATRREQNRQSLEAANHALQNRLEGMSERVDSLESAVASLARHSQQGRRTMLLDQAQMLLRMGQERYALFHDAAGALEAYTQASEVLAGVGDPAYAGVKRSVDAARKRLAATHPAARAEDLATLAYLRGIIGQLPLKPLDAKPEAQPNGFWQRVWHALSTAVVVRRVDRSPQSLADARLTRQLVALDVAQAEAARLAWNDAAYRAALKRVAQSLDTLFDTHDPAVRKARATVKQLLAEPAGGNQGLDLGKALKQLQAVRDVRGVSPAATAPAAPTSAPAPATSTAAAAGTSA